MRPYIAAFTSRFLQMLQYRTAALAGFVTQCWWGGIKVMVLAAFYASGAGASMPLAQVITYTWIAQGLLALLPWAGDPEVALSVRTGSVAYDRLRPVDAYALWFARTTGWIAARVLPRVALMAFAAVSVVLALLLSAAFVMLLNITTAALLNDRGINALATPLVIVLSGNLLPLALLPDTWQAVLVLQPFAGLLDIPVRLYFAEFTGSMAVGALGLQCFWIATLAALGHAAMGGAMRRLDVQGG